MLRKGFHFQVASVKHSLLGGKEVTQFLIRDKIDGSDRDYITYRLTVWDNLDLHDGEQVVLLDYNDLKTVLYKGKLYNNLNATVEPYDGGNPADPADTGFVNPYG